MAPFSVTVACQMRDYKTMAHSLYLVFGSYWPSVKFITYQLCFAFWQLVTLCEIDYYVLRPYKTCDYGIDCSAPFSLIQNKNRSSDLQ